MTFEKIPPFPKPMILTYALLTLVAVSGTYAHNYYLKPEYSQLDNPWRLLNALLPVDPLSNFLSLLLLIWALTEICYMFLTKRRNQFEKELAAAAAKAAAEATARDWYQSIKEHLPADAPPPPFAERDTR